MTEDKKERWKDIVGYEDIYQVSDQGRVKSVRRSGAKGGVLKMPPVSGGYKRVRLSKHGVVQDRLVHRLVLEAFVGPRPKNMECCHNDGDRENNRIKNLRWDTHKNNQIDMVVHGNSGKSFGEDHVSAKLTEEDVKWIRQIDAPQWRIAQCFGVDQSTISLIKTGKRWRRLLCRLS